MTFSIVARCPKTQSLGVAVATAVPAVGSAVPHVEANVGAIATQAQTNISYGLEGLQLLREGLTPQEALDKMLIKDKHRDKRQVIIIDAHGKTAAFTGLETESWKGHKIGKNHVVAGNMLVSDQVLLAMSDSFQNVMSSFAQRLLKALEAGQNAGGDKRGRMSAALKIADRSWKSESRPLLDLRVDAHPDPIKELHRIYKISASYFQIPE